MIDIKTYEANQVVAMFNSGEMLQWPIIPTSPLRATSVLNAPACAPTDVTLACAFNNQQLVGYLGLMPGKLQMQKVGWLSSMWVDGNYRGQGIAGKLIKALYDAWDGNIITTNQSPTAALVFRKNVLFTELPQHGKRYYYKSRLTQILPKKYPTLNMLSLATQGIDAAINLLLKTNTLRKKKHYRTFNLVTDEVKNYINQQNVSKIGIEELHWIMQYPWVLKQTNAHELANKYDFTITTSDYLNEFLVVYNAITKMPEGICLLMLKNGSLKISYAWYSNPKPLQLAIQSFIQNHLVYDVTAFNALHKAIVPKGYFASKTQHRPYFIATALLQKLNLTNHSFFDGDGDCCFA